MKMLEELLENLLPQRYRDRLSFELRPEDGECFIIKPAGEYIRFSGGSELALAVGLMNYLKYRCGVHYSWCGDQTAFPAVPPVPEARLQCTLPLRFRPYLNYCTFGYSATWWDVERWKREIDFMALNGVNMPLAVTGIEAVWRATFRHFGLSDGEIGSFLSGPAFLPWQWMDNIDSHAGPLPESWIDSHAELGREIVRRERAWGMTPILPGFSGHVPAAFAEMHPEAEYLPESKWCGFPAVRMLNPADPLFLEVTRCYMEQLFGLFGASHYYSIDLFHERHVPDFPPETLSGIGRDLAATLRSCDPDAVWVMQAWTENEHIIRGIPEGGVLVLDIGKERLAATGGLYGVPAVWGTIHSFGGQTELGGNLEGIPDALHVARKFSNLAGAGAFPESIANNPVLFELVFESAVTPEKICVGSWLEKYVRRRYGCNDPHAAAAWKLLARDVYTMRRGDPLLAARPRLYPDRANAWAGFCATDTPDRFFPAWRELLAAASNCGASDGYRFDLVDLGRQALSSLGMPLFAACRERFLAGDRIGFAAAAGRFLDYLRDCDALLGSRVEFRLDDFIASARRWGTNVPEADLYEYNVRLQLTLWGPEQNPQPLFDYCCREWQGLIATYYLPRWEMFFDELAAALERGERIDENALELSDGRPALEANGFYCRLFEFERRWTHSTVSTAPELCEDEIAVCRRLLRKYHPMAECAVRSGSAAAAKSDLLTGFTA